MKIKHSYSGFTLIELLLVVGIIGILSSVVLIALKPGYQFAKANDMQRTADIQSIMNGLWQYTIDNNGNMPADINMGPITDATICFGSGAIQCAGLIDLSVLVGDYVQLIPGDPKFTVGTDSRYTISKSIEGIVTINAIDCELDDCNITMTR